MPPVYGPCALIVTDAALVSLDVAPLIFTPTFGIGTSTISIHLGEGQQFVVLGTFSDGTKQFFMDTNAVFWSSSDPAVATIATMGSTVDSEGYATSVGRGTTTITATTLIPAGIISGSATLNVE